MESCSSEPVHSLSDELQSQWNHKRQQMYASQTQFAGSSNSRGLHADKLKRFRQYLEFSSIDGVRAGEEDSDDADEFYNDTPVYSKKHGTRYVQRPFLFRDKEYIEVDEGAKMSYDIYDNHRDQEPVRYVQDERKSVPPAARYDDSLALEELDGVVLGELSNAKYKNNICEAYGRVTFLGCMSRILCLLDNETLGWIDTKPTFTTQQHRDSSTWPYFPHTINQLKVTRLAHKDVLIACIDDGRLMIFGLKRDADVTNSPLLYEITMTSSVWGISTFDNYFAVSDNSQKVTLFQLTDNGTSLINAESTKLIHNVPDVEIINATHESVHIACVSISGELARIKFDKIDSTHKHHFIEETFPYHYNHNECQGTLLQSFTSSVEHRTQLNEPAWSVNAVNSSDFKEVNDVRYLGGNGKIQTIDVLRRSHILGLMSNHFLTSDLGGAAWYETIHIETKYDDETRTVNRLNSFTDKCSRVKKSYFELTADVFESDLPQLPEFPDKFLVVSTASKVGLYRVYRLLCNADSGDLYEFGLLEELEFSNRLSIVKVLPKLSCFVAVSQAGYFTVFRLVKHRGLHSFREEHVYPKSHEDDIMSPASILGLAVREMDDRTYWLYFAYSDSKIRRFELKENKEHGVELALL